MRVLCFALLFQVGACSVADYAAPGTCNAQSCRRGGRGGTSPGKLYNALAGESDDGNDAGSTWSKTCACSGGWACVQPDGSCSGTGKAKTTTWTYCQHTFGPRSYCENGYVAQASTESPLPVNYQCNPNDDQCDQSQGLRCKIKQFGPIRTCQYDTTAPTALSTSRPPAPPSTLPFSVSSGSSTTTTWTTTTRLAPVVHTKIPVPAEYTVTTGSSTRNPSTLTFACTVPDDELAIEGHVRYCEQFSTRDQCETGRCFDGSSDNSCCVWASPNGDIDARQTSTTTADTTSSSTLTTTRTPPPPPTTTATTTVSQQRVGHSSIIIASITGLLVGGFVGASVILCKRWRQRNGRADDADRGQPANRIRGYRWNVYEGAQRNRAYEALENFSEESADDETLLDLDRNPNEEMEF